jgi:CBS domain-containing protein
MIEGDESVGRVLSLFRDQDISHAPVVSRGKLVGMVSIRDIIEHVFQPQRRQTVGEMVGEKLRGLNAPVKHIMSHPVTTVLPENRLSYAMGKMHELGISSLIVATNGRPIGIVTKRDFLESIAQMEMVERRLTIQFSIRDVEMDDMQRSSIMDDFESLARRYEETLEAGTLFVYMKRHGANFRGRQLIHCRLQLRTQKGSFFSNSEGWNLEQTFRRALDRLDRQILRSKELENNPKYARMYLQRIGFPLTEL